MIVRHPEFMRLCDHADVRDMRVGLRVAPKTIGRDDERRRELAAITLTSARTRTPHVIPIKSTIEACASYVLEVLGT